MARSLDINECGGVSSICMTTIHYTVPLQIFREGDVFVAHSPAFDLATQGSTLEQAKRRFAEAAEIFVEECTERGTLRDVLLDLGWKESRERTWQPPVLIEHTTQDVAVPVA